MLTPNTILQNRYLVMRELGHGGMGTVYEALDQRVNCIVALKETIAGNNDEARRAFEREASLLGNLRHSALPKVMDFFTENDGDFLIMEFIPGYDLAELLELRGGPFPQTQVMRWADELLKVLEYLHGQNPPILHRDIKPSNLKVTKQGEVFLLDFGLAKGSLGQMPTHVTSRSVRGYTPVYASLEQILGRGTDARSDIYSLGATLYHLLTSVAPIDAPARFNAMEDDQPDPLQPIQKLNSQVSSGIATVIHQAMAISRKQRPISAAEMRKALRHAAEEDERSSAEEEYRRADAIDRDRQEEKRRAAIRFEEERRLQEAESRKKKEEASRQEEERRLQAEAAQRRAEALAEDRAAADAETRRLEEQPLRRDAEARHKKKHVDAAGRDQAQETVPAVTVPPPKPSSKKELIPAPMKTIPGPPPDDLSFDQFSAKLNAHPEVAQTYVVASNRNLIIGAVVLVVIAGIAFFIWSMRGTEYADVEGKSQPGTGTAEKSNASTPPAGMVYVSGGDFMMGRDSGDEYERPAHKVSIKPFFIDTYEVTNEDYGKFVTATSHHAPSTWKSGSFPLDAARKPVTGVTWDDANDYAKWAGKRLPTEEEWEFVARGTDDRAYPWGNDWKQGLANANGATQSLADAGTFKGASPFGAYDMAGNAWEWTASALRAYPGGRLPVNQLDGELKVIRGGSFESTNEYVTTTYRTGWPAHGARTYDQTGFRCVKDITK